MDEGRVERAGVRLRYVEWRPAEPARQPALLLLHGLSSNALVWGRVAERLPHRRVVALDQRSHGRSDGPAGGHAPAELVADAVHLVRELDLGRPVVAGHSWGAAVALELAATRPEIASGLALVDGAVSAIGEIMSWEEMAERMQPPLPAYRDLDEAAAAQAAYVGDAWGEDLREFVRAGLAETPAGGLVPTMTATARLEILRWLHAFRPDPLFPGVEGPLLLAMAGELWPEAPAVLAERRRRAVESAREARPDLQVRWYDSRHDIPLIRPGELAADLDRLATAAAFWSLARDAAGLEGDWTRPAHDGPGGWSARDLLAHLASTQATMAGVVSAPPPDGGARAPFEPDRWNASQVRRRAERTPAQLAAEMRSGAQSLHAALMGLDPARPAAIGRFAGQPVRVALERTLDHQRGHLGELRSALAGPGR